MNGMHVSFGEMSPEKTAEQKRSATAAGKDYSAGYAAQSVREDGKTDITVSVSEGAVGSVEEELYYKDVRQTSEEKEAAGQEIKETSAEEEQTLEESTGKLTEEDYDALVAEGITVEELTATQLTRAIERIRLGRELSARQLAAQKEKLQAKRVDAVEIAKRALKGNPAAEFIAEKLMDAGMKVTEAAVHNVYTAVEFAGNVSGMSESIQYYLLKNGKEPTIENVYMAQYSAGTVKSTPVSDAVWDKLMVSANQVIVKADLSPNGDNLQNARWLTEHGLAVDRQNLYRMRELEDSKKRTPEEVAELAVQAMKEGKKPIEASLTMLTHTELGQIVENVKDMTTETVDMAYVKKAAGLLAAQGSQTGAEVSKDDLKTAMQSAAKQDVSLSELAKVKEETDSGAQPGSLEKAVLAEVSGFSMDFDISVVRAKRRLEEIRLKMTTESAYRLERQGIKIDTSGLAKVVDGLRLLENNYYRYYTEDAGVAGNRSMEDLFKKTMQNLDSLSKSPSYTLGVTFENRGEVTLSELSAAGTSLSGKLQRAGEAYETLGTRPQAALGDSIKAAFTKNTELLRNLGLPDTAENQRAVRILAYNSLPITGENLSAVKEYDQKVTTLIGEMHPAAALRLIREGINPLTETVDSLSKKVGDIKKEEGIAEGTERFARYLFKVEKNTGISPEEKSAYIGLYRLFNRLEQTDGAAIGAVMESGRELTLGNLLSAMRTANGGGVDVRADETLGKTQSTEHKSQRIDEQILSGIKIPPKMSDIKVNDGYELYKESATRTEEETRQAVEQIKQSAQTAAQAPEFLKSLSLVVTANNVEAAKEFLSGTGEMYRTLGGLLRKYRKNETGENALAEKTETGAVLTSGGTDSTESLFDFKVADGFYRNLKREIRDLEDDMTQGEPEAIDLKTLRQIKMGVKLRGECAGKQCFDFPVETKDGLKSMRVTLKSDSGESGKASLKIPLEKLGNVQADINIEENQLFCFVSSDSREGTDLLENRKRELTERLLDLGVSDAMVYFGNEARTGDYTLNRIPGIDTEGNVTEPQNEGQADTGLLLAASKAVFVQLMEVERA